MSVAASPRGPPRSKSRKDIVDTARRAPVTLLSLPESVLRLIIGLTTYGPGGYHEKSRSPKLYCGLKPGEGGWLTGPMAPFDTVVIMAGRWNLCCWMRYVCKQLTKVHEGVFTEVHVVYMRPGTTYVHQNSRNYGTWSARLRSFVFTTRKGRRMLIKDL